MKKFLIGLPFVILLMICVISFPIVTEVVVGVIGLIFISFVVGELVIEALDKRYKRK